MYYINKRAFNARKVFVTEEHKQAFLLDFFKRFIADMKYRANNDTIDVRMRVNLISEVLRSNEFRLILRKCNLSSENWKLVLLLKLKMAKLIYKLLKENK